VTRIAVVGSINMDLVAVTERRPLPGETVTGQDFFTVPGGKGLNQAVAAAKAGADVSLLGAVGSDAFGAEVIAALAGLGLRTDGISHQPGSTGVAHIVVDGDARNSIIVIPGANALMTSLTGSQQEAIKTSDVLLLQQELPLSIVEEAAEFAAAHGVTVVLTPAPVRTPSRRILSIVDVLVPNEHEALELCARLGEEATDPLDAARILARYVKSVVVTLGDKGAVWFGQNIRHHVPAVAVDAVDTTAAGDTFVGVLAAVGLENGRPTTAGLQVASAAAALACQRRGASSSMPTLPEIHHFMAVAR
jgi:ribokinase